MATEIVRQVATLPESATGLTKHMMGGRSMPPAQYIVIETSGEGTYIFRYSKDWKFSGDTWHHCEDDALAQIDYEFGSDLLVWRLISHLEFRDLTKQIS